MTKLIKNNYYLIDTSWWVSVSNNIFNRECKSKEIGRYIGNRSTPHYSSYLYGIEFINKIGCHDCNGKGKLNYCLWVKERDILKRISKDKVMVEIL